MTTDWCEGRLLSTLVGPSYSDVTSTAGAQVEAGPSVGPLRSIADMLSRVELARRDSESAAFDDLIALGELTVKLAVLGLTAGLQHEYRTQQYAIEYDLVRADSIGTYEAVLRELVNGETRRGLDEAARRVQGELNTPVDRASSTWQATALDALLEACACLAIEVKPGRKIVGRRWFDLMPQVRNRVRHSAPTIGRKAATIDPLERSIRAVVDGLSLFRRPWFYARRQISGRVIAFPLVDGVPVPESIESLGNLTEGVYIHFDEPRRVPLVETDETLRDVWIPNGAYNAGRFELISYVSDTRRSGEGAHYQSPPIPLPKSETQGLGSLEPEGQSFTNLPPLPRGYVDRRELEDGLRELLSDDRHPVITLHGGGGVGKTSLALAVLHRLTQSERFTAILWFSARDVDLAPTGPRPVRPHLVTIGQIADEAVRLMEPSERTTKDFNATTYCSNVMEKGLDGAALLFAFDNFETVAQPAELFRWIDTYIRPPNKVLITTRQRAFTADFPLEVRGMKRAEFTILVERVAGQLGIQHMLTKDLREELLEQSGGSPYIGKVLLGHMALPGTQTRRPKRLVASRSDILDALFDRTFAAGPVEAQRVFLGPVKLRTRRGCAPEDEIRTVGRENARRASF